MQRQVLKTYLLKSSNVYRKTNKLIMQKSEFQRNNFRILRKLIRFLSISVNTDLKVLFRLRRHFLARQDRGAVLKIEFHEHTHCLIFRLHHLPDGAHSSKFCPRQCAVCMVWGTFYSRNCSLKALFLPSFYCAPALF